MKKLIKHGNDLALIIDKHFLDALSIDENTVLNIRVENDTIILKRAVAIISDNLEKQKSYEKLFEKYAPTLKKLAEN
jgi:antitoxin component of MazEF toxin-antitoxin module